MIACGNEEQYVDVGSRDYSPQPNAHAHSQPPKHHHQHAKPHSSHRANQSAAHSHTIAEQDPDVVTPNSIHQEPPVVQQQPRLPATPEIPLILVPQKVQFPPIEAGRELHRMVTLENRSKTSYIWVLEEETPAYVKVC